MRISQGLPLPAWQVPVRFHSRLATLMREPAARRANRLAREGFSRLSLARTYGRRVSLPSS